MSVLLKNVLLKNTIIRPWKPIDVPNNKLWLDAPDFSTITLNGSDVSLWSDKSGNNHHIPQATANYQPAYVENVQNGKAAILFNGTSTWMERDGLTDLGTNENFTTFIVAKSLDPTTRTTLFGTGAIVKATYKNYEIDHWSSTLHAIWRGDGSTYSNITHIPNFTNNSIFTATGSSTLINTWVNGVAQIIDSPHTDFLTPTVQSNIQIGARVRDAASAINPVQWFNGYIYEIIHYNRVLTNTERQLIEAYLSTKYAIT